MEGSSISSLVRVHVRDSPVQFTRNKNNSRRARCEFKDEAMEIRETTSDKRRKLAVALQLNHVTAHLLNLRIVRVVMTSRTVYHIRCDQAAKRDAKIHDVLSASVCLADK